MKIQNYTDVALQNIALTKWSLKKEIKSLLEKAINEAISKGYVTFITGMATGTNIRAAEIVLKRKKYHRIIYKNTQKSDMIFLCVQIYGWVQLFYRKERAEQMNTLKMLICNSPFFFYLTAIGFSWHISESVFDTL